MPGHVSVFEKLSQPGAEATKTKARPWVSFSPGWSFMPSFKEVLTSVPPYIFLSRTGVHLNRLFIRGLLFRSLRRCPGSWTLARAEPRITNQLSFNYSEPIKKDKLGQPYLFLLLPPSHPRDSSRRNVSPLGLLHLAELFKVCDGWRLSRVHYASDSPRESKCGGRGRRPFM